MDNNRKILILGGSSFIGRRLFDKLGPERAVATYCNSPLKHGIYFNALNMSLSDVIADPGMFSHAVIMLGDTDVNSCARNIKESTYLNVTRICAILDELDAFKIFPVFMSTESVFDGEKGKYIETDPVNPILKYGEMKVRVERYLQGKGRRFLILRLGRVFGSEARDGTLFTSWLKEMEDAKSIECAVDQIFSPIYVDDVADAVLLLIGNDCEGIFHVCGKKSYSRMELFRMLLINVTGYIPKDINIIPRSINDFKSAERRPLDISMIPDKLIKATGVKLNDVESICRRIVRLRYGESKNINA